MQIGWGLIWALALALALAPFSKADVCQKGTTGASRLKMLTNTDGRVQFVSCRGKNPCVPIGPKGQTFSLEELSKAREDRESAKAGAKAGSTAGGILSIFFFSIGDVGDLGTSSNAGEKEHQKELRLAGELKTLAPELLTSDEACHNVASLENHKAVLGRVLTQIYKASLAKQEIPAEKLEDTRGSKDIKAAPTKDSPQAPASAGSQRQAG